MGVRIEESDIRDLIGSTKKGGQGHLIGTCPYCKKEGHFYIRLRNDVKRQGWFWDCKKCKEEGGIYKLLKFLGRLQDFVEKTINTNQLAILIEEGKTEEEDAYVELPDKQPPIGFERIYSQKYLSERFFLKKDFYKFRIGTSSVSKRLKDYVIFLIEEDEKVKGYVSRCLLPKEYVKEHGISRYKNSSDTQFGKMLFGYEELTDNTKVVILVEGLFDKIRLDNLLLTDDSEDIKVLCTFGNKVSKQQIAKLLKFDIEKVILFYDLDAIRETKKYADALNKFFEDVEVVCLIDGKDPSDSDDEQIFEALSNPYSPSEFRYEKIALKKLN